MEKVFIDETVFDIEEVSKKFEDEIFKHGKEFLSLYQVIEPDTTISEVPTVVNYIQVRIQQIVLKEVYQELIRLVEGITKKTVVELITERINSNTIKLAISQIKEEFANNKKQIIEEIRANQEVRGM